MEINDSDLQRKIERELRLHWQSHVVLWIVLLPAMFGLAWQTLHVLTPASAEGLGICAAFGLLVWRLRAATPFAAFIGFLLTAGLYLSTVDQPHGGWFHTALPSGLTLFVLAFASTRFRRSQKEKTGLAESRRGRRASQVAANMGVAALVAVVLRLSIPEGQNIDYVHSGLHISYFSIATFAMLTAIVAALAEAAADTVSSEIGQAIGGRPRLLVNGSAVPPGTDGAVTPVGTAAGCLAAAIVVVVAMPTLRLDPRQAAIAFAAAIAGLFADSLIGATLERHGWLNNDAVNFLSTAIAALLALLPFEFR